MNAWECVRSAIRALRANLLRQPGSESEGAVRLGAGSRHNLTEEDAAAIAAEVPGVLAAAPTVAGDAHFVHGNRNWSSLVGGVTPDYLIARDWRIGKGRAFTSEEVARAAKVVVLGATVAAELFPDEAPLGQLVRIANVPFIVIGVLGEKGQAAES